MATHFRIVRVNGFRARITKALSKGILERLSDRHRPDLCDRATLELDLSSKWQTDELGTCADVIKIIEENLCY